MRTFLSVLSAESLKMSKSHLWLVIIASPLIAMLAGFLQEQQPPEGMDPWPILISSMSFAHSMLFLPIMTGLFSSFICRYEHTGGGWKQLLVLPVSRTAVYMAKFTVVMALLALCQLIFLICMLFVSWCLAITYPIPWSMISISIIGGWIACMPLAALQLGISLGWASFAAPLAINVSLTIPNVLIINSDKIGPFYPWAQPLLAMIPHGVMDAGAFNLPLKSLLITILGSFVLFFAAGLVYFRRKEI